MTIYKTPYIDLWFKLTIKQRRKLSSLGYGPNCFLYNIAMSDFLKVTKDKKLIKELVTMKRSTLKLVA